MNDLLPVLAGCCVWNIVVFGLGAAAMWAKSHVRWERKPQLRQNDKDVGGFGS